MTIENLKQLLRRYHIKPNKTFGQHFLMDELVLADMVDAAAVSKDELVLEVGFGIGNLTERLSDQAGMVLTIDKDKTFIPILQSLKKTHKNIRYEIADILRFDFQNAIKAMGYEYYKVVANIPYYITGKIIQLFMQSAFRPKTMTVLMQKEVAKNVVAEPGELNILALSVQLHADAQIIQDVPKEKFYPAPKVDSAVLQLKLLDTPRYTVDERQFFRVVKACFLGKRKQLHNSLVNNVLLSKEDVGRILEVLQIDPKTRPQELSLKQWVQLSERIRRQELGI
jgi:16S rRNA (adenine1518-N6/adenine1519-N6)-dimethyltransferase